MITVYVVVNEEESKIHFASEDELSADAKAEELTQLSMIEEADDLDIEYEELDEEELNDLAFISGFNGGAYSVLAVSVNVADVAQLIDDTDTFIVVTEDISISYNELFELLAESASVDSFGIDGEFESFEGEFENLTEYNDDEYEDFFGDEEEEDLGDDFTNEFSDAGDFDDFDEEVDFGE